MFQNKTPVAVLAGMAVAGSILMAPGVVAAPTTGRAFAWGANGAGQLGDNSATDSNVPVAVDTSGVLAGKTVTAINAGQYHSCAVGDGRAYCWGGNGAGQLGDNSTNYSNVPVAVDTSGVLAGKTLTAITAGNYFSCAVADGKAYCWGGGQLGSNSSNESKVPVAVDTSGVLAGKTVTAIDAGNYFSCVVADGRAYCWGANGAGQLGDNSTTSSNVPVAVDTSGVLAGKTVTAINAGQYHSCAVADGRAYCWGGNGAGQLGDNSTNYSNVPVAVDTSGVLAGKTLTAITAGDHYSCAVADGRAYCWGANGAGQLGDNSTTDSKVPVAVDTSGVLAGKTVTAIDAGDHHSCAVADGRAYCWGGNGAGQLGDNSTTYSNVPVAVDTSGVLAGRTVTAITAGQVYSAVLALGPPQPPTAVAAVGGDARVTVSWAAPGDDGGSPVLAYTATSSPGGKSCTTASTSCTISELTNGTSYTVTVTATNAIGTSAASAPSNPVTPAPTGKQKQTLSAKLPKRIKRSGTTVITPRNARTNAGQRVRTIVRGGPNKATAAGEVRYFKVIRGKKGKVSIRTYGYKHLKFKVTQKAPATTDYRRFKRTAIYRNGTRR